MSSENNDRIEELSVFRHPMDFSCLIENANKIQEQCEDFIVKEPNRNTSYGTDLQFRFRPEGELTRGSQMSNHAFSQLCSKLGVPVRYMQKCIEDGQVDLVSDNINTWIEQYDKPLFVRTYGNRVRGVLSDRFSVLDTPEVLDIVSDTVQDKFRVKQFFMNEERFHARLIQKDMLNIDGEDLFAGMQVDTSDVGRSILIVKFMLFKQVCTNGLTISKGGGILFSQKHIGISADDFRKEFSESIRRMPEIITEVSQAVEENRKKKFSPETLNTAIEKMREKLRISEDTGEKIIDLMNEKYSRTRWGLVNATTEVAQQYTLERRLELENYAGSLLIA